LRAPCRVEPLLTRAPDLFDALQPGWLAGWRYYYSNMRRPAFSMRARFAFNPRAGNFSRTPTSFLPSGQKEQHTHTLSLRHQRINNTPCVRPARARVYIQNAACDYSQVILNARGARWRRMILAHVRERDRALL